MLVLSWIYGLRIKMASSITLQNLLDNTLPTQYRDKIFWYASHIKIDDINNQVDIHIDSTNCLVAFDDVVDGLLAMGLNVKTISNLAKLGTQDINNRPMLVSSGTFLWINDKLLVTQRTAAAKFDPSFWTTPAGRCDTTPLKTAYKETAEEIHGFDKVTDELWMPQPTLIYFSDIKANGYEVVNDFPKHIQLQTSTVNTWVDDEQIETAKMWYYYSESVNTLELRVPMYAQVDKELYFKNAEFDTNAGLMSIEELQERDVVPAVDKLIKEIEDENTKYT